MTKHTDEELIAIAKAATPGEWKGEEVFHPIPESGDGDYSFVVLSPSGKPVVELYERYVRAGDDRRDYESDGKFIATFNPAFVLSLIERAQAAEARARTAEEALKVEKGRADRAERAFDWLTKNPNCELSHGCEDEESEGMWRVHRVNGGVNDREWTLISADRTPLWAIERAVLAEQMAALTTPTQAAVERAQQVLDDPANADIDPNEVLGPWDDFTFADLCALSATPPAAPSLPVTEQPDQHNAIAAFMVSRWGLTVDEAGHQAREVLDAVYAPAVAEQTGEEG